VTTRAPYFILAVKSRPSPLQSHRTPIIHVVYFADQTCFAKTKPTQRRRLLHGPDMCASAVADPLFAPLPNCSSPSSFET
jgi:hypothetical protein